MKLKNVKILSFVLAFLAVFMMLPLGSMTAYAVNDEVQADTQLQNENANGLDTQADGAIIEEETMLEIETEICYEEYAVEDLNPVAPSLSQSESSNTRDATTIADGVYAFKNIGNANMWMNVEEGNIFPNTYMCQISSTTSPVNSFDRSCLFKVTNVSGTNRYIIRSMVNNRLTFGYSNGYVKTKEIPPDDDDVDIADTFILERDSSTGYVVIKPYGSGNYCIAPNRNAESGAYLSKKTTVSAPNQIYWQMFQYTGAAQSGTVISRTAGMGDGAIKGQNYSVWLYTWSTIIGANTPYMCVHPDYASVATVGWNSTTFCATVTGTKADDLKIYAKILYDGASTSVHTGIYSFVVIPDIDGKTVFLQNVATGKYAEVDGASLAEEAVIQQISLHTGIHARWLFELDGSGYFTIKSVNSGLYLGVPRHSVSKVKQFAEITDYMRWKIVETASGNHKLICKASGTRYSVLAVPSTTSGDGVDLNIQSAYTADENYNDEWIIKQMLPLSGYELDYDESAWSGLVSNNCNCYAYAINNQLDKDGFLWWKQQPGEYKGIDLSQGDLIAPATNIIEATEEDFAEYGYNNGTIMVFTEIGRYETCPQGTYKVALVIAPYIDYHWYRQDSDGFWSHKQGVTPVKRTDESGNYIIDPQDADLGIYTQFIGYFAVTPWNNYYIDDTLSEMLLSSSSSRDGNSNISSELLETVQIGMLYEDVIEIIGNPIGDIGSGVVLHKYITDNQEVVLLNYCKNENGQLILCNIIYQ